MEARCPFCRRVEEGRFTDQVGQVVAFPDEFPLTPGHLLVVPRAHQADFFELDETVQSDVWRLLAQLRRSTQESLAPDGYNVGINVGDAAGQTVGHAHVHLIPRYAGDVSDPRGGVRWVVPDNAAYWAAE